MNICILCRNIHKDLGGIETFVREYSYALGLEGHMVHIIAQDRGGFYREPIHPNVKIHDIALNDKPFIGYYYINSFFPIEEVYFAWKALQKIDALSKTMSIDIVEIMDYFRQGIALAIKGKFPLFLRLHGWMFNKQGVWKYDEKALSSKERWQRRFMQICINKADGIASVSKSFAQYAASVWKIPTDKLSIIHNAVDVQKFNPGNVQARETSIIFSSRMLKNKGVVDLVDALIQVFKKFPELKVYFAGSDQRWDDDKMMAKEYILKRLPAQNLVFLGVIPSEDIINYYRKCKISVLPSLYEPFGLSALEAMACGCAIVATKAGGLVEFIDSGINGILVEINAPNELAQAIEKFIMDDPFRDSCTRNAVQKVGEQFTYKNLTKQSLLAYRSAIEHYQKRITKGK